MSVLVGKPAPDFQAAAVLGDGKIVDSYWFSKETKGKYVAVVFYPLDFTFVCPTELIALDRRVDELKKRGVEVIAVSIDSQFTHNAWRNTPVEKGGIGPVRYTMVADVSHAIAKAYDVEVAGAAVAYRGTFLIDRSGIIRHQVVNDLPLGRNMDELVRMVDALQFCEEHGEVCPAGWNKGQTGMSANPEGVAAYLSKNADKL
ncbi:peroxiredoxin [Methylocaldum sp.]|uniref:peroxiredoxin n=1 Tax=Methylocaldum sp. TaxID=1969727 RepID=UPI002D235001|nr:peroxiredoxin [Methylocaldum sp.]HYE37035.1 peroxiredoxin [Methylocaldum sp.]